MVRPLLLPGGPVSRTNGGGPGTAARSVPAVRGSFEPIGAHSLLGAGTTRRSAAGLRGPGPGPRAAARRRRLAAVRRPGQGKLRGARACRGVANSRRGPLPPCLVAADRRFARAVAGGSGGGADLVATGAGR